MVDGSGFVVGLLSAERAREALAEAQSRTAAELARTDDLVLLLRDDDLQHALHRLSEARAAEAVVIESPESPRPVGIVTREAILDTWHRANT